MLTPDSTAMDVVLIALGVIIGILLTMAAVILLAGRRMLEQASDILERLND